METRRAMTEVRIGQGFLLVLCFIALQVGCVAPEITKQGSVGEYCAYGDTDCRPGLICDQSVCNYLLVDETVSCESMCERLASCETGEDDCIQRCRNTIDGWGLDAIRHFGECIIGGLTCEEARRDDAPQVCYDRIPLDDARNDQCTAFLEEVKTCYPESSREARDELLRKCRYLARTASDEKWSITDSCVESVEVGVCEEVVDCLNSVLQLRPPLPGIPLQ